MLKSPLAVLAMSLALSAQTPPPIAVITEYSIPAGGFPHDPAVDPSGVVWYTAQRGNRIGRLNPADGRVTEFAIPTANSGPHGLVSDSRGHIWFTENSAGKIGALDPVTGQVTEYPATGDPHTPIFDQRGILWFTLQNANRVGRLDPATGEVRLVTVPTANARPYGIRVDGAGTPWFVEFGTNKLAKIDPQTLAIQEFVIPDAGARPRRMAITTGGDVYFTDFNGGRLGRFRPNASSGEFKLWDSPSGRGSQPYGIAVDPWEMLWYNESAPAANKMVRFDPRDESFATITIPTPGSIVRHMESDSLGRLWLAESGIDKIGKIEPAPRLTTAGIVNAAGFFGSQIAPGEILSIFGANLAFATGTSGLPLARELAGVSITIGGLATPLFYGSPGQINAQVPYDLPLTETQLVARQGGSNQQGSATVRVAATAPGIFVAVDGVTAAAIEPATGRAFTAENPATPGALVSLFASGLGAVVPALASGAAAGTDPLHGTMLTTSATIAGQEAAILFSGLAPGFAGLYQINLRIPSSLAPGAAPILVTAGGVTSNSARIAIR